MRFSTNLVTIISLLGSIIVRPSIAKTLITDPTVFPNIKCLVSVAVPYSNGCNSPSLTDACGHTWNLLTSFNISDGYGDNPGVITLRYLRRADLQETYLLFPGSLGDTNYGADLNITAVPYNFNGLCSACMIHGGFIKAHNINKQNIITNTKNVMQFVPNDKLVILGGSLGAALASLFWAELYSNWGYNLFPVRAATIGQPRVGNGQYAALMNRLAPSNQWTRVTHGYDAIVRSPTNDQNGVTFLQHSNETWCQDDISNGNRPDAASTYFCPLIAFGGEPTDCVNNNGGQANPGDHTTYPGGTSSEQVSCS